MNTEHEHEYFLDNESTVYACECGALSIGDKIYYPAEELKQRDETIKQLKEALKEMIPIAEKYQQWLYLHDGKYQIIIDKARKLLNEC